MALGAQLLQSCLAGKITEIGIRPENLKLVSPDQPCAMGGEVYVVEPMGNETLIDVRIGGERVRRGLGAASGHAIGHAGRRELSILRMRASSIKQV